MNKEEFLTFIQQVDWRFAKSIPNWPHFYVVEKELADQTGFKAAKSFIKEFGYDGKFYDKDVRYFEVAGWSYWASPLAEPSESQNMLNRCKTEYTFESLAEAGLLPLEGFRESTLLLAPVLADTEFKSLVRDAKKDAFTVFDALGPSAESEILHSNVLSWLLDRNGKHNQGSSFLNILWNQISGEHDLPQLSFVDYSVIREGQKEEEKIDLLLSSTGREWIIVIENKLFSPETGNQLERYFQYIENRYSEIPHRFYFYLTPDGIAPAKVKDSMNWRPISYLAVKQAVSRFLENPLSERIRDFLIHYLEHIESKVLKSPTNTEKRRNILSRHKMTFHSLEFMLEEDSVRTQCSDVEFDQLNSIFALAKNVERELFDFTKRMIAIRGYRRYSGRGHWITIELPALRDKLAQLGYLNEMEAIPIVFAFVSHPHSYVVEIWLYKNMPLFSKAKGRLVRFSEEAPERNRGDEHFVEVLYRKTLIQPEEIIQKCLSELKDKIAAYFDSDLERDLNESVREIENMLAPIGMNAKI